MRNSAQRTFKEPKWTEEVIAMGKGAPNWSRKYNCLVYCVAGISKSNGWRRIYPVRDEIGASIQKFDVIQAVIRNQLPESFRPESRKIYPSMVKVIDHIHGENTQKNILKKYTESGNLIHGDAWRSRSLGLIQPLSPRFKIIEGKVKVRFHCTIPRCTGHIIEVIDATVAQQLGTREGRVNLIRQLYEFEGGELRFLMGTHSYHPHRWLVISMYNF